MVVDGWSVGLWSGCGCAARLSVRRKAEVNGRAEQSRSTAETAAGLGCKGAVRVEGRSAVGHAVSLGLLTDLVGWEAVGESWKVSVEVGSVT
eukprot:2228471-Rhodomonas_salina.1